MSGKEDLDAMLKRALAELADAKDSQSLEKLRVHYLGQHGRLSEQSRQLRNAPAERRPIIGRAVHHARQEIERVFAERKRALHNIALEERIKRERLDLSLPGQGQELANLHPLTCVLRWVEDFFVRSGFTVASGPEVEDDFHNFSALNIPADHPARAMHDTFYLRKGQSLLRTHTTSVQIRTLEKSEPPLYVYASGPVYRCDSDMTHSPMFHQAEVIAVDELLTFAKLRGLIEDFLRQFFADPDLLIRFRPSYFPFTEPSAEVDMQDQNGRWLEVAGCGMVNPRVLETVRYDAEKWRAYAFGFGIERLAMLRYGLDDLRLFFNNDLRFLRQFAERGVRFSLAWLRERAGRPLEAAEIDHRLTMAGLEVASCLPLNKQPLSGICVARIDGVKPHPTHKRLHICRLNDGGEKTACAFSGSLRSGA